MIHQPLSRQWHVGLGVASVLLLACLYLSLSYSQHLRNPEDTTLPGPGQLWEGVTKVFAAGPETSGQVWIWIDARTTFVRLAAGLGVGVAASVVLGLLMGCYAPLEAFFLPPLAFLAKIPPTAMLAVFFALFGVKFGMFVGMIAFGVLPTLTQAVYQSAKKDVPDELIYKAFTLGASPVELIWDVVYKIVLPRVLEVIRLQVGPALVYLIAAEYAVGGESGFGYRLRIQSRLLNMNVVYAYLVFLGITGYLLDHALTWSRRKLCPWYGE